MNGKFTQRSLMGILTTAPSVTVKYASVSLYPWLHVCYLGDANSIKNSLSFVQRVLRSLPRFAGTRS